ncbi:MAG: ATP-binding protein [Acidobacteriota bacterium]
MKPKKLIYIGLVVLLSLLIFLYYVIERSEYFDPRDYIIPMFLYLLSVTIIILILGVLFILIRNFVKLIVERKRGILGSKFRTKLIFIFFIPLLVPSITLFYAAITIIQKSVDNLLTPPVDDITKHSSEIVDYFNEDMKKRALSLAREIGDRITQEQLLDMDKRESLARLLDEKLEEHNFDVIVVHLGDTESIYSCATTAPDKAGVSREEMSAFPEDFLESTMKGQALGRIDYLPRGYLVRSAVPILSSFNRIDVVGSLLTGIYVHENLAEKVQKIDESRRDYLQMKVQKREIKRIYIYIIALIALLILFSATWVGMYLTRQITVPVQKMAEGTREISAGNLDYRVDVDAGDELGMLVDSFNRMTGELKIHKLTLEERRNYIETLLDNITTGVISLNSRGEITTINRTAIRILDMEPGPWGGVLFSDAIKAEELREFIWNILGTENLVVAREFHLHIRGGVLHLAANFISLKDVQGNYLGVLIVLEDVTQLIRAQKMEAWREVAKRIAHEIKNPLTPIQLSAQRIMKKSSEDTDDFKSIVREGASTIITQVHALKGMVDEFSRFARMPAIRITPSDPHAVLEAAIILYESVHAGVRFIREYDTRPTTVSMDPDQMKRVMINLIDNSIEAMNRHGTIRIATKALQETRRFRVEFSDDGPGIAPEDKGKLFIPYFSTKKVGTGLGLAIVQRIISDHNGYITVEDNLPHGAKFIIELPL